MKYLKLYEVKKDFKFSKGDIVLRPGAYSHTLHLLLQDVNKDDEWIKEIQFGVLGVNVNNEPYASFVVNRDNNQIAKFRNNKDNDFISFRHLTEQEMNLVYTSIKKEQYNFYLNILKDQTGIDLREKGDYKNWLIEQDAKKYNL